MTLPLLLGGGERLFGEGTRPGALRMVEHEVTAGGNLIATYAPHGEVKPGSFEATAARTW